MIKKEINNSHEYKDLGLPSGTKWATCNIGADRPEKYVNSYGFYCLSNPISIQKAWYLEMSRQRFSFWKSLCGIDNLFCIKIKTMFPVEV